MKNILAEIVAHKEKEVADRMARRGVDELERSPMFSRDALSLRSFLKQPHRTGIIAEFKRKSPSKGIINDTANVQDVTAAYARNGASGLSVLTDQQFFGGSMDDLQQARAVNNIPILRKDFVIGEYQIVEAKAIGADVILLIAECLTKEEIKHLAAFAHNLGLEVLLEVHSGDQLDKITPHTHLIGINNRDLKTFQVDIHRSMELLKQIPAEYSKVAESGMDDPATIVTLKQAGFDGFLIGEHFMKAADPGNAFELFTRSLKEKLGQS
ncbi:indole-3-glycerol phosphate synthase TrpC [Chitinophaga lutea]|uniref:Indole-3-glycerol phosphate synthase n=1 Tax=Chitinophaga lutea TaxID=2488634 RepID=A0A3N4PLF8_9BACT|nr:indole-3-glycerol phosphate synthase TrpC [Chitinophaga lutea]RPE09512.1 indole-3-glycerol phosphate synthase TrpC [Chitinophaga lutea]